MKNKKTFESFREGVLEWGALRGLLYPKNADVQYLKFVEEVAEFEEAWNEYREEPTPNKRIPMMTEFGDVLVTLIILAAQLRIDPIECLELAYTKIKDRKGKTINGTFVKEEDL